jgi:hypothetical protein
MFHPFKRLAERRRKHERHLAAIDAANERARWQTRAANEWTGGDWVDGRWERTQWEGGRPVRTYRGTRSKSRLPDAPLARSQAWSR